MSSLDDDALSAIRHRRIGFVFQQFNLLPAHHAPRPTWRCRCSTVTSPGASAGSGRGASSRWSGSRGGPSTGPGSSRAASSSGSRSRAPSSTIRSCFLADEPTGNLDTRTSAEIMAVVQDLHRAGLTIVLVTHEPDIAQFAQRVLSFRDGELVGDERIEHPRDARAGLAVAGGAGGVKIGATLQMAAAALRSNRLRTALTALGVIIGVGAVVTMMAVGAGRAGPRRRADPEPRLEPDHRDVGLHHLGRRPPRLGQPAHDHRGRRPRDPARRAERRGRRAHGAGRRPGRSSATATGRPRCRA